MTYRKSQLSLLAFVDGIYVPRRKCSEKTRYALRWAVRALEKYLGHKAHFHHLTEANITAAGERLAKGGKNSKTVDWCCKLLVSLLRGCEEYGFVEVNGRTPWSELRHFLEAEYGKHRKLCNRYRRELRHTIRQFEKLLGHPARLVDLTPENIAAAVDASKTKTRRKVVGGHLRALLRCAVECGRLPDAALGELAPKRRRSYPVPEDPNTLAYVLEHRYLPARLRVRSPQTIKQLRMSVDNLREYLGREPMLSDLTDENLAGLMRYLLDVRGLREVTVNGRRGCLCRLWDWCARKRMVEYFPTVECLPEPETIPIAFSEDEVRALFKAAGQERGKVGQFAASDWWLGLLFFLWDSGARIGETLSMTWAMIDLDEGRALLPATIRKGRNKSMCYWLFADTVARLRRLQRPAGNVFPIPAKAENSWLYGRFSRILRRAGLPDSRYTKFHAIRRSFGTHLENSGGDANKAFRHSAQHVTDKYRDPRLLKRVRPCDLLFRPDADDESAA